jgi:hypothetical protein
MTEHCGVGTVMGHFQAGSLLASRASSLLSPAFEGAPHRHDNSDGDRVAPMGLVGRRRRCYPLRAVSAPQVLSMAERKAPIARRHDRFKRAGVTGPKGVTRGVR